MRQDFNLETMVLVKFVRNAVESEKNSTFWQSENVPRFLLRNNGFYQIC
jgi:hypothetical protein